MPAPLVPIIGLEIHVELATASKMFCPCANDPLAAPNTNVCEVCLAHPGTLPVPNRAAIAATVKIARALGCAIAAGSKFDRKHYFYPDLPKGYQISQYDAPVGEHGRVELRFAPGKNRRETASIGVTRVHLEEDTAKLSHDNAGNTLVDFNRAGVPLVEIVSDPDVQSGAEAKLYCQELQLIFRALGVSGADMEKGQMRCEANISLQEEGKFTIEGAAVNPRSGYHLNPKVEVKNINSFRAVERAVAFEIERQTKLLQAGETWGQETRGWDDATQATIRQRSKETAADYRYFPEPDIPPFSPGVIAGQVHLPELPQARRSRFMNEYGLAPSDAWILGNDGAWANFTEHVMSELFEWCAGLPETRGLSTETLAAKQREAAALAAGWITSKLMGAMAEQNLAIGQLGLKPENFAELITLLYADRINSTNAKKILSEMLASGVDLDPTHIMEENGYGQISDEGAIAAVVAQVLAEYPAQVAAFRAGKEPLIKFLIGMAMKATEGSADPQMVEKLLREKLNT